MKKRFLYYYLTALILGSLLLYSGCSSLIRKDGFSSSPNGKNLPDSFDIISDDVVVVSKRKLESFLVNHGVHEKVLGRLRKCDLNFILSEVFVKSSKINMIVDALKLATVTQLLYDYANGPDQFNGAFKRGSFSIEDKGNEFFKLLKKSSESLGSYFYDRNPTYGKSSHYKDSPDQYGVDIALDEQDYPVELPPYGHHVLFGSVKKGNNMATFVKCEPYGLKTWSDFLYHAKEFMDTTMESSSSSASKHHREKDLPEGLKNTLETVCAIDPFIGIPAKPAVHDIVNRLIPNLKASVAEAQKIEKDLGYSTLGTDDHIEIIRLLEKAISQLQGGATLAHLRTGNECVVPQEVTNKLIKVLKPISHGHTTLKQAKNALWKKLR